MLPMETRQKMNGKALSQEDVLDSGFAYFDVQAYVGTTKHMGGLVATKELLALCRIGGGSRILDLGCGVGATPCYVAETHGVPVVGIDIHRAMVAQARERARRESVENLVDLSVADASHIPFGDALFGATIGESVISFVDDKQGVLHEAVRVTEPGGYVGFNEEVWLKTPPSRLLEFARRTWEVEPLSLDKWVGMLEDPGLHDIVVERHEFSAWREASQVRRYHLVHLVRMAWRTICFYVRHPSFRTYMSQRGDVPSDLFDYLGYALLVGRKQR